MKIRNLLKLFGKKPQEKFTSNISVKSPLDIYSGKPSILLAKDENAKELQIKSYSPGEIATQNKIFHQSIIISPHFLIEDWRPQTISELQSKDLQIICEKKPELLLLGTGEKQVFPQPKLFADIYKLGIGIEIMTTAAACRTYNVLLAEDRNVIAALIIT
jgi:uncharacterized protein